MISDVENVSREPDGQGGNAHALRYMGHSHCLAQTAETENVCGQPQQCRWGDVGGCGPKTKVKSVSGRQQVVDVSRFNFNPPG